MTDDFAPDGQLAKAIPGFKPREPQRQMAVAVTQAIEKGQPLVVEAGTGTGKTYCYIKTMFELHEAYGWSKFIVVVPSVAIREGVAKSFEITAEHFFDQYGKRVRSFIYNSKQLHHL